MKLKEIFLAAAAAITLAAASPVGSVSESVRVLKTPSGGEVPDAEIDVSGTIHVAYVKGDNAFYAKSVEGNEFTEPVRINSEPNTVHPANMFRGPDVAVGKNGRVHVIWYVNAYQRKRPHNEWGVFYSYFDPGSDQFAPPKNLNRKPSDNYSLAADEQGNVAVVWMAEQLFLTFSKNNGKSFETETVSAADPCECCASRALFDRDGTLLIAYRDKANNARNMHLLGRERITNAFANRRLSTTEWEINACPMTGTFLARSGVKASAAWETKGSACYARLEPNAAFPPKEIKVTARGKWPLALMASDGTVLASWKEGSTLFWRLLDGADKPLDDVQSVPSPNSHRHAGVMIPNGRFVLIH
jgi:hypothetical protein